MSTKPFQVNKEVTGIQNPVIAINQKQTGPNTRDIGLLLNRGSSENVALIWNEINNLFRLAFTTDLTSDDNANLNITSNAPIATGTQYVSTGNFAVDGDARAGVYVARNTTSGTAVTELFLNGVDQKLIVTPNSVWTYEILLSAKRIDGSNFDAASFKFTGATSRNVSANSVALVGTPSLTIIGRTDATWLPEMAVDLTTGALVVKVKGSLGKTVRWVAKIVTTEVVF
jgi:hypothetical protein